MADKAILAQSRHRATDGTVPTSSPERKPRKWRCLNCGQLVFTGTHDSPSDICQCCKDMTTWQAQFD